MKNQVTSHKSQVTSHKSSRASGTNCIAVFIFLSIFVLSYSSSYAAQPLAKNVSEAAPDFKLLNLSGQQISLSGFRGKPVILFIWTTWCPFCRAELVDLQGRYKGMKQEGIELLAVDTGETKEKVEKFLANKNMEFPVLLDSASGVANAYNIIGVPTLVLIDSQGKIRFQGNELPGNYIQILTRK